MQPHFLDKLFWAKFGKIGRTLGKSDQDLGRIKILHPQNLPISYGYV